MIIANGIYEILQQGLNIYKWVVILAAVLSNLIAFGVVNTRNRLVWTIADFLYRLTEPVLRRIRTMLPSFGGLDLSPIVLLVAIYLAQLVLAQVWVSIVSSVF